MKFLPLLRVAVPVTVLLLIVTVSAQAASTSSTDKLGRKVDIPIPVQRAVFLQMYEFLPVMDVWDQVAGVSGWAYKSDFIRRTTPDIESVPAVGRGGDPNVEAILQLKPDLVLTWAVRPESIRFMAEKGLRVFAVYPESIQELYGILDLFGTVFQREETMKAVKKTMEDMFSLIRERTAARDPARQRKILYLGGQMNSVSCGLGINNDLIRMIGGRNPADRIRKTHTIISLEQIVIWNPEVIFIWGSAGYTAEDILNNPQWRHIAAVRNKQVYKLPRWSTWSPRLPLVGLIMAKKAYPDDYQDMDPDTAEEEFLRKIKAIHDKTEQAL